MIILQPKRWGEIMLRGKAFAEECGLSKEFIEKYLWVIHDESINQQEEIMKGEGN